MRIAAQLHSEEPTSDREAERRPVGMRVGFRKRGYDQAKADVLDLSAKGFKIDTAMSLGVGTEVWLTLPGMTSRPAIVKWSENFIAGCEFIEPLHIAVLEDFLKRNNSL
ncbi:MAG: pilus assembly protein PilZ [Sphingomonadaceae bacterium]|nr:pilus assembly protein PilZ [Sphingomonadaceae bacterium]